MKQLIFIVIVMVFANCSSKQNTSAMEYVSSFAVLKESYIKDKKQIAHCFIENVEYFRKYHRYDFEIYVNSPDSVRKKYNDYYSKYPGAERDPANFFEPYATRYSLKEDKYVTSPLPTNEQLTVATDTLVYSKDSLFCVGFLIIKGKYSNMEGIEGNMVQVENMMPKQS